MGRARTNLARRLRAVLTSTVQPGTGKTKMVLVLSGSPASIRGWYALYWALCRAPFIKRLGFCLWVCFPALGPLPSLQAGIM